MPFAFHLGSIAGKAIQETVGRQAFGTRSVFILGHWQWDYLMHNVFSCDKHFGYNTTYQTVFPHLMMGTAFFKKNMSWLMPDKRPTDNMELAVDLPQEERVCIGQYDALYLL